MLKLISRFNPTQHTTLRPLSSKAVYGVTDLEFWEDETRPIPNRRDTLINVETEKTRHLRWEKTLERLCLIGEVSHSPRRVRAGMGFAIHFCLRTRTVLVGDSSGYKVLDQFHRCVVHSELLQKKASKLHVGSGVRLDGQIFYTLLGASGDFISTVLPTISVDDLEMLGLPRTVPKLNTDDAT